MRGTLLGSPLIFLALLCPTPAYAAGVPVNATPPSISGTPMSGQTLTASPGAWTEQPTEFRYRWERCSKADGTCIWYREESPENQSYVVIPEDVGNTLRVRVTAVNEAGKSEPATSAPIEVETTALPRPRASRSFSRVPPPSLIGTTKTAASSK